jgi:hypothetical protein
LTSWPTLETFDELSTRRNKASSPSSSFQTRVLHYRDSRGK